MGSVSLKLTDGTARFRRATLCSSFLHLIMLLSVLTTNLFALYAFTHHPTPTTHPHSSYPQKNLSFISDQISTILRDISSEDRKFHQISRDLSGYPSLDPSNPSLAPELKSFLARHPLPLGPDSRSRITHLVSSVSHSCKPILLNSFMSYPPGAICPGPAPGKLENQSNFELLGAACDPLPRRRCLTPRPRLAAPPQITDSRWIKSKGKNDFTISEVLSLTSAIQIQVGLDVAGNDGVFAVRMGERNVTVVTTTAGGGAEVIAARGVIPVVMTTAERFPFQDSVFDIVHVMKGLDEGGMGDEGVEFLLFDVDRVLRTGGLLWIDNYLCVDDERKRVVTRILERFGYKKMRWVVGEKAGGAKAQLYLSAVLQKPARG